MAERSVSLGTPDSAGASALRSTLHAQQELLQQLYNELDVEREASATATSEALSMILRLQGEKSAVEMEASQYKRIAEEKMFHAQETLEIFRDLIYQKEMQIASLEFQVQAYRFKLLSLGCNDIVSSETQYPENMLGKRPDIGGDKGRQNLRKGSSVPPVWVKEIAEGSIERLRSAESSPKILEEVNGQSSIVGEKLDNPTAGDFASYWEQIRKLDERIKELSIFKDFPETDGETISSVNISQPSPDLPHDPEELPPKFDGPEEAEKLIGTSETSHDSPVMTKVQDIFEVPATSEVNKIRLPQKKEKRKLSLESDNRKEFTLIQELFNSGATEKTNWAKRPPLSPGSDNRRSSDGSTTEAQLFPIYPTFGVADLELQQLNRRLKRLEDERIGPRSEISVEPVEGETRLLKEIKDQLNLIQEEILSWRTTKYPLPEDDALVPYKEVTCWPLELLRRSNSPHRS